MIFCKVSFYNYNIFLKIRNKNMLIATIRTPLVGMDKVFLQMYFPYEDSFERTINVKNLTEDEMLEKAERIVIKHLYKISNDILEGIQSIEFNEQKYKRKYVVSNTLAHGNVYAAV